jgi:hypothetical protein
MKTIAFANCSFLWVAITLPVPLIWPEMVDLGQILPPVDEWQS